MPSRRRRSPLRLLLRLLVVARLCVLALGIWLGARHPDSLPGPVRDVLAGDDRRASSTRRSTRSSDRYYRKIPRDALADDAIAGAVAEARRPLLELLHARPSTSASRRPRTARSRGIGVTVSQDPLGPARRAGLRRLAGQARRASSRGDVIVAADGQAARRASRASARHDADQGPAGHRREDHRRARRQAQATLTLTRSAVAVPVVASTLREACGKKLGVVALSQFSSGAHAEVYAALQAPQEARRRRPTCSTCAATAAASSTRRS